MRWVTAIFLAVILIAWLWHLQHNEHHNEPTHLRPTHACVSPLLTIQQRLNLSIVHRVALDDLLTNNTRRQLLIERADRYEHTRSTHTNARAHAQNQQQHLQQHLQQPQQRPQPQQHLSVLLCLGGVIARGVRFAWPVTERRIVTPLRARGHRVDIYGIDLDMGSDRMDHHHVDVTDVHLVPFRYLERMHKDDVDAAIAERCKRGTCPHWFGSMVAGPSTSWNGNRQLLTENIMGEFLLRPTVLRRYDVAIVWWADFYPLKVIDHRDIELAASTPGGIGSLKHRMGFCNGFHIGRPAALSKLLMRWSDETFIAPSKFAPSSNGTHKGKSPRVGWPMYERTVADAMDAYNLHSLREVSRRRSDLNTSGHVPPLSACCDAHAQAHARHLSCFCLFDAHR